MIKTTYSTNGQTRVSGKAAGKYTYVGTGHFATCAIGAVSKSVGSIWNALTSSLLSLSEVCVFDEQTCSRTQLGNQDGLIVPILGLALVEC